MYIVIRTVVSDNLVRYALLLFLVLTLSFSNTLFLLLVVRDLSKDIVKVLELDGNHEVKHKEGTENDREDEKYITCTSTARRISHFVHYV